MINASMLINKSLDVQQDLPPDAQILDLRSWPFQYGHVHTVLHRTIDHRSSRTSMGHVRLRIHHLNFFQLT